MLSRIIRRTSHPLLTTSRYYTPPPPKIDKNKLRAETMALENAARSRKISAEDVGKAFRVHRGNYYVKVQVKPEMVGYRYGEFVMTRTRGPDSKPKPSKKRKMT